jgi:hypothetical protein|tara:strand:+ start:7334 stop:7570 length:237 start_codon:yes stop_codon:yes gene_type:complete
MTTLHNLALLLGFIVIFIIVHIVFKNIRQLVLIGCKLITTTYIWAIVWVLLQLHRLPEWQQELSDSVWTLVNMTKTEL